MSDQNRIAEILRIHPSSQGLNSSEIDAVAQVSVLREYATGEKAVVAGQRFRAISLVISGLFELSILVGESAKSFGLFGPNDQIGTFSIVRDEVAPADVVAVEPSVVIEIENVDAQRLVAENRVFARNLLSNAITFMTQNTANRGRRNRSTRIAFAHVQSSTQRISQRVQSRLRELGERIGQIVNRDVHSNGSLCKFPTLVLDDKHTEGRETVIRQQLAEWSDLDRVVFDVDFHRLDLREDRLRGLFSFPERVYLLVEPESAGGVLPQIKGVLVEHPEWSRKLNLIWVLNDNFDVAPHLPELTSLCNNVFKIKIGEPDESFFQRTEKPGIERVVHDLRGVRIGLALGGGAARGMSHLGVLKAFDEAGVIVDAVAGTSVGAMMGVSYCCGYSPDEGIRRFTTALTPRGMFRLLGDKMYLLYKYRSKSWDGMLRHHFFDWKLEQLLVPLTTIAADLVSAEEFVRETGDAVTGILESINLGGISVPICRDGMVLVDGGYLNNVPADSLVRQGADFVISVDVSQSIKKQVGKNTADTPTEQMKPPSIGQVLGRIREVAQKNLSLMGAAHADFVISPRVEHVDFADFKSTPSTAEIGYQEALSVMPRLLEKLNALDDKLFPLV